MLGFYRRQSCAIYFCVILEIKSIGAGADPGFFLGGGALVSCSTSTPINHIFFFCRIPVVLENRRSSRGWGGGAHPLHPPPRSTPVGDVFCILPRCWRLSLCTKTRNKEHNGTLANTGKSTTNEKNIWSCTNLENSGVSRESCLLDCSFTWGNNLWHVFL